MFRGVRLLKPLIINSYKTRQFSVLQKCVQSGQCQKFKLDLQNGATISSSSIRLMSVSFPRCTDASAAPVKEELIFTIPNKPVAPPTDTVIPNAGSETFTIPDKPSPVDLSSLGEPSFESLGLATWYPSGRMQYFLENLHIGLGMEWYQAIAFATLCMRTLMFPAAVMAQRNVAHMNNNMPAMSALQEKISDARRRGDMYEMAQYTQELQVLSTKKGINPFKNIFPMMIQLPVFMSFFFGLRGMANCPVESMATGGALWFENLTLADPYYLLPILTSLSLYIQLRTGAEGAKLDMMTPKMKIAMTVLPFVLVPITMNFASAVSFYWLTTNLISLVQARILKLPVCRKALNIPQLIEHKKVEPPKGKKKGFRQSISDTIDNFRAAGKQIDRRAYDDQLFRDAGKAKPVKTYSFDPTKLNRPLK